MTLRNEKLDIEGRSLILNLMGVLLNLIGVYLLVIGFHESTTEHTLIYKIVGTLLVVVSLFGMTMLKGIFLFSYVARALVGGLFIVSGLVKA